MTLHPQPIPPVPLETTQVPRAAFPKGNLYMRLRDTLGVFFSDETLQLSILAVDNWLSRPGD